LLANDALRMLGLAPGATANEIRQAYRDLVKVWHPDRFGSDARLRAKAEEHLKKIIGAYRTLEANGFRSDARVPEPAPPSSDISTAGHVQQSSRTPQYRELALRIGLYLAAALLLVGMGGFLLHQLGSVPSTAAPESQPVAAPVPSTPPQKPAHFHHPADQTSKPGTPGFQVWSLSQGDSDHIQLACSSHPPGSEGYRNCIAAQLHALQRSSGTPQMAGMSAGEREAAETACSTTKRSGGESAYNLCLRQQIAALAAEPIRPDLSTFSEVDRNSIQAACSSTRQRGAAEYDHCLTRFAKIVSDSQPLAR